jgi:hypothetical protein
MLLLLLLIIIDMLLKLYSWLYNYLRDKMIKKREQERCLFFFFLDRILLNLFELILFS